MRKTEYWHISDWPYPSVSHEGDYLTTFNLLTLQAIRFTRYFINELGNDASYYESEASALEAAIRKHLIIDGLLLDCLPGNTFHQGVNALGVLLDIFSSDEKKKVIKFIEEQGFASSVILGRSTLRVMQQANRMDFVYKYLFEYEKGWLPMIEKGNLTFFEGYDDIESHCHAWQGFPIRIIQDHLKIK
jgi:alpha-L-rhamnosidase